jgi:hypothetical protein
VQLPTSLARVLSCDSAKLPEAPDAIVDADASHGSTKAPFAAANRPASVAAVARVRYASAAPSSIGTVAIITPAPFVIR